MLPDNADTILPINKCLTEVLTIWVKPKKDSNSSDQEVVYTIPIKGSVRSMEYKVDAFVELYSHEAFLDNDHMDEPDFYGVAAVIQGEIPALTIDGETNTIVVMKPISQQVKAYRSH